MSRCSSSRWIATSIAIGALAGAALALQAPDVSSGRPSEPAAAARELLAGCKPTNVTAVEHKLVALGPRVAFELTRAVVLGDETWTPVQRQAVEGALQARSADARAALLVLAQETADLPAHTRALELLASIGSARDLSTAVVLARTARANLDDDADLDEVATPASALRSCAARLIERAPAAPDDLPRTLRDSPDELAAALIDALADVGRPSDTQLLSELLREHAWSETYLLGALARSVRKQTPPFDDCVRSVARDELDAIDATRVREAAACVGWLEDADAAEALAVLLAHEDRGVRTNARWALQRITGRSFAPEPQVWLRWIAGERAWWYERSARAFENLAHGAKPARMAALNEIVRRTWPRHELALELALCLPSDDEAALGIGCAALASLNSRAAVAPLRELLERTDGAARASVEAALRTLDPSPVKKPAEPAENAAAGPGSPAQTSHGR